MTADVSVRARHWALILVILVLGFGLRTFHLGAQSIWYDEGLSVLYAGQSLPGLFDLVGGSEHLLLQLRHTPGMV